MLLTPVVGNSPASRIASRLLYHLGRISTYAMLGLVIGAIGESIIIAGLQRWLSLTAGVLMLVVVLFKSRLTRPPLFIKSLFGSFLHRRSYQSIFALGAINGLLPCGLVYMAASASLAEGGAIGSISYMLLFGLGTMPMLLAIAFGARLAPARIPALQKLAPITVTIVALLLIVRGDPVALLYDSSAKVHCPSCVR
jgi:sulfite exporter TauE/SafE